MEQISTPTLHFCCPTFLSSFLNGKQKINWTRQWVIIALLKAGVNFYCFLAAEWPRGFCADRLPPTSRRRRLHQPQWDGSGWGHTNLTLELRGTNWAYAACPGMNLCEIKHPSPHRGLHSLWRAYTLGHEWSAQMFSESNLNCKVKGNTVCIQREKRGWRKECEMSLQMGITPQPLWHILMPVSVIRLFLCSCRNLWNHHVALKLHTTSKPSHLGWLIQFRKQ